MANKSSRFEYPSTHAFLIVGCFLSFFFTPLMAEVSVIESLESASKSVVRIETTAVQLYRAKKNLRRVSYTRQGAGVIIATSGLIATNWHTVKNSGRITVIFYNGVSVTGRLVRSTPEHDLAFINIQPPYSLTAIKFSDSDLVQLNSKAYTIGTSKILKNTLSEVQISGIGRKNSRKNPKNSVDMIQINSSAYKGDSGSPLLDREGHLLGLMVATQTKRGALTYAIPSNTIKKEIRSNLETSSQ